MRSCLDQETTYPLIQAVRATFSSFTSEHVYSVCQRALGYLICGEIRLKGRLDIALPTFIESTLRGQLTLSTLAQEYHHS